MEIEKEKKYFNLITQLKILSVREFSKGNQEEAVRYKEAAKMLKKIRENQKLDEIGYKGERTLRYERMLREVEEKYDEKSGRVEEIYISIEKEIKKEQLKKKDLEEMER